MSSQGKRNPPHSPASEQSKLGEADCGLLAASNLETPARPRFFDACLLFHCLEMLQIDRRQLASDDPLLFRELQGICTLCRSQEACWYDLAYDVDGPRLDKWRTYCPNSALLRTICEMLNSEHPVHARRSVRPSHLR